METSNRAYNRRDIKQLLKLPAKAQHPSNATTKSQEFQAWFASGIRTCNKHPYPFVWCIIEGPACPKCRREAGEPEPSDW